MRRLALVLLSLRPLLAMQCYDSPFSPPPPSPSDFPLCGNGQLDPGEVCDDSNRQDGDGCNAYCTAFDTMTSTCTLAGNTAPCPYGKTQILTPAQTLFCNLRAVDAPPSGEYVILADDASLIRFDLFTDTVASSLTLYPVSLTHSFRTICSLAIWPSDESIVLHECGHRLWWVSADGHAATLLADLRSRLIPSAVAFRAHYDTNSSLVWVAGEPIAPSGSCAQIWTISTRDKSATLFLDVPCILYSVWNNGIRYPSYSILGMRPHRLTSTACPPLMRSTFASKCIALLLQRDDLLQLTVYAHEDGGSDITTILHADLMSNALGLTLSRSLGTTTYVSRAACFYAESTLLTPQKRTPATSFLGSTCRNLAVNGWPCITPLNNPFVTDVMSSPYLLPLGLSSTHTHQDLSLVFNTSSSLYSNISAGPLMYKNTLRNAYGNTTPIDFVPLPNTHDIVYITSTSVGLISTKRNNLYDRSNPGYCRATNLLYCPPNSFGTVGAVCSPCSNTTHPMYARSVAWQIMCASAVPSGRRLLSLSSTRPYTRVSVILGANAKQPSLIEDALHQAMEAYARFKCVDAPFSRNASFLSPMQPYNMLADSDTAATTPTFVQSLLQDASQRAYNLFKNNTMSQGSEYITTMLSYDPDLPLLASLRRSPSPCTSNTPSRCATAYTHLLDKDPLRGWLACYLNKEASSPARRRLLSSSTNTDAPFLITENQGITLASSTHISWSIERASALDDTKQSPSPTPHVEESVSSSFPIWIAILVALVSLLVVLALVACWYRYRTRPKDAQYSE
jgi:cysteine-rich repeat protein